MLTKGIDKSIEKSDVGEISESLFSMEKYFKEVGKVVNRDKESSRGPIMRFWYKLYPLYRDLGMELSKKTYQMERFWKPENDAIGIRSYETVKEVFTAVQQFVFFKLFDVMIPVLSPDQVQEIALFMVDNSLGVKDIWGLIRSLWFEVEARKWAEIEAERGILDLSDKLLLEVRGHGGRSATCSLCKMPVFLECVLPPCGHPVCLLCAAGRAPSPQQFLCPACPFNKASSQNQLYALDPSINNSPPFKIILEQSAQAIKQKEMQKDQRIDTRFSKADEIIDQMQSHYLNLLDEASST
jgi:hypothetical protein